MAELAGPMVEAVTRALAILDAFTIDDASLRLTELARRTALPKNSVLRLARTLAAGGYLSMTEQREWRLGPAAAWLGARYQVAFDLHNTIEPEMRSLAQATGRSVSYFVHDGHSRIRLLHVHGGDANAGVKRVGEPMPMDRGSPGQVLLAFSGRQGALYDTIRKHGYHLTIGEARRGRASVSAPVFGSRWTIVGAITIGVPAAEATESLLRGYVPALVAATTKLSRALAQDQASITKLKHSSAAWFPT
ncbi:MULTISPECIES: IclR family transcriptional regulator [Ramlibacter]|uniref:Helix-turn-helix domain-containing protein n=1 Tax=Ramlibacter pinisoli TaxID=2682844 RepID=A0A6N8J0B3_9BURK|nr:MULTISPECIES: helix-turn-helix domain-containing protein [Ramlibacter]MBA2961751.1 helix-turn-helix domain-containing protein [Ramlibacter sp. CGMCC 1.13660]MVQ31693.1 helix-turn-helix domain-containing protein [Ramlibacter pinisoli]